MTAREKERRDSLLLVLLILLLGFICIILAGGWALRFVPSWRLPANMDSKLNPDSFFLTNQPIHLFEPLDPDILASPSWFDTFLTPGAVSITRTPPPSPTITPFIPPPRTNTLVPSSPTPSPTPFIPPVIITVTRTPVPLTSGPGPTATFTNTPTHTPTNTPIPVVDLQITKDDFASVYTPGASLTYTIVVTNNGPSGVSGAIVTDAKPVQITSWSWTCQSQTNGASGCDAVTNSNKDFNDTVNLPNGASITYLVTAQTTSSASGNLVNTASVAAPAGAIETNLSNNSATDQDTPELVADLQITKTDNTTTYIPNMPLQYVIVAFNAGPSDVTGAIVGDTFPADLTNITWTCSGSGGASCTAAGAGAISDTTVNLPAGGSVTYIVDTLVSNTPGATIENTAKVTQPPGVTDPNPGNNSTTDTDTLIPGLGTSPDSAHYILPAGQSVTINLTIIASGPADIGSYDLVYYEFNNGGSVYMDLVRLEIGDGQNWYTIFDWGDQIPDANSSLDYGILPPGTPGDPEEVDERPIPISFFYREPLFAGVQVDIDAFVPPGTYSQLRITAYPQPPDLGDGLEVDAIEVFPP